MRDARSKRLREWALEAFMRAAAAFSVAAILAILLFLAYSASPLLKGGLGEILRWEWRPHLGAYGILPMVVGSLCLSLLALGAAFPAAVGICLFAHGLGPPRLGRFVFAVISFMTSIPTVVYAFVSAILLVPLIRELSANTVSGYSLLAATVTLSVLILPTIVLLIDAWWRGLEPEMRMTGAALGLTRAQTLIWILLPLSSRALGIAAVLGFGRAVGDTMISLLVAGNAAQLPASPLDSVRTLTAHIALMSEVDTQSLLYHSIFACGLFLFALTALLNLTARRLRLLSRKAVIRATAVE